jgi:hypothetical protein
MLLFNEDLTGDGVIRMVVMGVTASFSHLNQETLRVGLQFSGKDLLVLVAIGLVQSMRLISSLCRDQYNIYLLCRSRTPVRVGLSTRK